MEIKHKSRSQAPAMTNIAQSFTAVTFQCCCRHGSTAAGQVTSSTPHSNSPAPSAPGNSSPPSAPGRNLRQRIRPRRSLGLPAENFPRFSSALSHRRSRPRRRRTLARTVTVQPRIHHHPLHQRHFLRARNFLRARKRSRRLHLFRNGNRIPSRNRSRLPPRFSTGMACRPRRHLRQLGPNPQRVLFRRRNQKILRLSRLPHRRRSRTEFQPTIPTTARMLFPPGRDHQRPSHQAHRPRRLCPRPSRKPKPSISISSPATRSYSAIRRVLPQLFVTNRQRGSSR